MDIPNRKVGSRPIATMSFAIPMATKVKKTASRKMMTAFRGAFRKGLAVFMKSAASSRISNLDGITPGVPISEDVG